MYGRILLEIHAYHSLDLPSVFHILRVQSLYDASSSLYVLLIQFHAQLLYVIIFVYFSHAVSLVIGMIGAFIFIILQVVFLIDFAHNWAEAWYIEIIYYNNNNTCNYYYYY